MGTDSYMVSRQAATGFSGAGSLKAEAYREASEFCVSKGRQIQVVSTKEAQPPYVMGNFPRAEVEFMCLLPGDPELTRPRLAPVADKVVEIHHK